MSFAGRKACGPGRGAAGAAPSTSARSSSSRKCCGTTADGSTFLSAAAPSLARNLATKSCRCRTASRCTESDTRLRRANQSAFSGAMRAPARYLSGTSWVVVNTLGPISKRALDQRLLADVAPTAWATEIVPISPLTIPVGRLLSGSVAFVRQIAGRRVGHAWRL